MALDPRTPVLIGYGQVNQRDERPDVEPVDLMAAAAREAADPRVLEAVDSVRVVNLLSWRYRDPGLLVAQRIRADKATTRYTGIGGNVPQALVNQACLDIQHSRADAVLIAGAETWRSRTRLRAAGRRLEGTPQDESVPVAPGSHDEFQMSGEAQIRIKLDRPANVYPLFEQAVRIATGSRLTRTVAALVNCGPSSPRWRRPTRTRGTGIRYRPNKSGNPGPPTG
jgi:acetyl-CoA C-acetyltransferase